MSNANRPYSGTWRPNSKKIVSYTPDALVYLNGMAELPGADGGNIRFNIQKYVTQISVDGGVESGATSASLTLSIPRFESAKIYKDGGIIFHTGMEVHIYARGYFPTKGLVKVEGLPQSEELPQYPYYHIFHGVVTSVSFDYSGGNYSASLSCSSMLHFWSYQYISTSGSVFGARPTNSGIRTTLRGHNFANKNAYEVLYTLYRDFQGAAHGVSWTFSQKTNINATFQNQDLYSINLEYWKRRFSTRLYGLRMYGASGQLYSATQQAFLSGLNRSQAKSLIKNSRVGTTFKYNDASSVLRAAYDLGLIRVDPETNKIVGGADQIAAVLPSFTVSPVEISAYVDDVSAWGSVNFFESTYESKMDMANKIKEMTDFEFYQDMDGDLVFKPPFYNLDTSSSRVYRIEPEDIINLSFTENEPEATYYVVRAGHWQQVQGLGMDGEWGVSGRFVDYRLVAQYGWRQGDFETHYYNTPKSAFFAAVAKMAVANSKMNTASLTIPFRPELRAGYPVYISHIDTFYYVESLSHSFSYGGQCTTSIQLTARRRKFHAPRNTKDASANNSAVDTVDLARLDFPPTPIITSKDNHPKEVGFPNVVMALDPTLVNPLFYVTDDGVDYKDRNVVLNLIRKAEGLNLISPVVSSGIYDKDIYNYYKVSYDDEQDVLFNVQEIITQAKQYGTTLEKTDQELYGIPKSKRRKRRKEGLVEKKATLEGQIFREEAALESLDSSKGQQKIRKATAKLQKLKEKLQRINDQILILDAELKQQRQGSQANEGFGFFELFEQVSSQVRGGEDVDRSATLLEVLSDKKSQFTNDSIAGSYRYYSSAHPDPAQQGVSPLRNISGMGMEGEVSSEGVDIREGFIKEANLVGVVAPKQFKSTENLRNPFGKKGLSFKNYGEIELADGQVSKGLVILKAGKKKEETATHDIRAISFQDHSMSYVSKQIDIKLKAFFDTVAAQKILTRSLARLYRKKLNKDDETPLNEALLDVFSEEDISAYEDTSELSDLQNKPENYQSDKLLGNEGAVKVTRKGVDLTNLPLSQAFEETGLRKFSSFLKFLSKYMADFYAARWAQIWIEEVAENPYVLEITAEEGKDLTKEQRAKKLSTSNHILIYGGALFNINNHNVLDRILKPLRRKEKTETTQKVDVQTPVFPVSDNGGYEVIGSFPYGRGLSIEPGANWSKLAGGYDYDPLSNADPEVVDGLIKAVYSSSQGDAQNDLELRLKDGLRSAEAGTKASKVSDFLAGLGSRTDGSASRDEQIVSGLRNLIVDRRNAPTKISPSNNALRLSDIQPIHDLNVPSSFRAAEELFEIEAFNEENFIAIEGVDQITAWSQDQITQVSGRWKERQNALRGVSIGGNRPEEENPLQAVVDGFNQSFDNLRAGGRTISSALDTEVVDPFIAGAQESINTGAEVAAEAVVDVADATADFFDTGGDN